MIPPIRLLKEGKAVKTCVQLFGTEHIRDAEHISLEGHKQKDLLCCLQKGLVLILGATPA